MIILESDVHPARQQFIRRKCLCGCGCDWQANIRQRGQRPLPSMWLTPYPCTRTCVRACATSAALVIVCLKQRGHFECAQDRLERLLGPWRHRNTLTTALAAVIARRGVHPLRIHALFLLQCFFVHGAQGGRGGRGDVGAVHARGAGGAGQRQGAHEG